MALAEADEAIVEEPAGEPDALAATEPEVEEPEALAESADPVEAEAPQLAATEVISEPVVQPLAEAEEPDAPQLAAAEVISEPVVQPVPEAADSAELAENEAEPAPAEPEEPELAEAPEEISEPQVAAREVVSEPVVQDIALADEKPEAEPELAEADDEQQRAEADEASPVDDEKQTELASAAEADPVSEDDEPAEGGEERVAEGDTEEAAPEVGETDNALAASEDAPVPDEADDEFALAFGDEFDLARLDSSEGQDGASERAAALNFAWSRTGDSALLPRRIYDDGASTYIVWDAAQAVPTILIRDAAGEEGEATYDLRGQTVVIGQVPALIVLRNENASATLENLRGPAGEAAETASEEPAQASLDAETEPDERL
ncbi:MAG: TrbG/VirB9 family P-type conjugative transfer protein [Sphingomonadaceae bacterium]